MPPDILDQIDLVVLGDRLQRARKLANLTQEEAAQFLGFARTTIVAIEKGERKVRPSELVTLARAYKTSVSELVRASEDVESFEVQFRVPWNKTAKDNDEITESIYELESLCQNYLMLEQKMAAPLSRRYPMEYSITPANVSQSAESIAIEERSRLGVGDGPIHLMRDMLENEVGLRIFYLALPSRFSAMYFYSERLGGCIAVNRKHPEDRRRWSLAHDYGHFLTSRYAPFIMMGKSSVNKVDSERFADDFSMYFLMPTSAMTRKYNELSRSKVVTVGDLCTLAHYFGVSFDALVRRLEGMRLIRSGTGDSLRQSGFKVREAQKELHLPPIAGRDDLLPIDTDIWCSMLSGWRRSENRNLHDSFELWIELMVEKKLSRL